MISWWTERMFRSWLCWKRVSLTEDIVRENCCDVWANFRAPISAYDTKRMRQALVSGFLKFSCNRTLHVELVKTEANHEIAEDNGHFQRSQALFIRAFTESIAGKARSDYFESNSVLWCRQQRDDFVEFSNGPGPAVLRTGKLSKQANLIRLPFNSPEESFYKLWRWLRSSAWRGCSECWVCEWNGANFMASLFSTAKLALIYPWICVVNCGNWFRKASRSLHFGRYCPFQ